MIGLGRVAQGLSFEYMADHPFTRGTPILVRNVFPIQILSYLGYVELDYRKIEDEVMGALDIDSDGKVDSNDIKEVFDRVMKVCLSTSVFCLSGGKKLRSRCAKAGQELDIAVAHLCDMHHKK